MIFKDNCYRVINNSPTQQATLEEEQTDIVMRFPEPAEKGAESRASQLQLPSDGKRTPRQAIGGRSKSSIRPISKDASILPQLSGERSIIPQPLEGRAIVL